MYRPTKPPGRQNKQPSIVVEESAPEHVFSSGCQSVDDLMRLCDELQWDIPDILNE
jgi:hypothetical protein